MGGSISVITARLNWFPEREGKRAAGWKIKISGLTPPDFLKKSP